MAGFTIAELVVVMVIIGVLAAYALPRLVGRGETAGIVFRDRVVAGLRLAQKTAVGHRRLVCAATSSSAIVVRIASSANATACASAIAGESDADYAAGDANVGLASATGLIGVTLYFQPNGDITLDAAGATPVPAPTDNNGNLQVQVGGVASGAPIVIDGATGYVD
jgi:MSHA pilin protein MshC